MAEAVFDSVVIRSNFLIKIDEEKLVDNGYKPYDKVIVQIMEISKVENGNYTVTTSGEIRKDMLIRIDKKDLKNTTLKPKDKIIVKLMPMELLNGII